ncbi:MAG: siderophore-interacting protein [Ilumatobacteraceae bacterium]
MAEDRLARVKRLRREPPPLLPVEVVARVELSARMLRLTFEGDGLRELLVEQPAASVRLLVPSPGTDKLVIPTWNGNEFLLPDGSRPSLRTFTPMDVDNGAGRLEIEIVRHPGGAVSAWAETVAAGSEAAISGPGSGYDYPTDADTLVVLADETALPAAIQLAEMAPDGLRLQIHAETVDEAAVVDVDLASHHTIEWHVSEEGATPGGRLVDVVQSFDELPLGTDLWAGGEASAMHAIRTHLFDTLGVERQRATVRGYWKPPRCSSTSTERDLGR